MLLPGGTPAGVASYRTPLFHGRAREGPALPLSAACLHDTPHCIGERSAQDLPPAWVTRTPRGRP